MVGINWEIDVSIATCVLQEIETYDVIITATDESGVQSTLEINVKDPNVQDNSNGGSSSVMVVVRMKEVRYQVFPCSQQFLLHCLAQP